jgi:hypothetical protein
MGDTQRMNETCGLRSRHERVTTMREFAGDSYNFIDQVLSTAVHINNHDQVNKEASIRSIDYKHYHMSRTRGILLGE